MRRSSIMIGGVALATAALIATMGMSRPPAAPNTQRTPARPAARLAAPVPQYYIADAAIFIRNAATTAALMDRERRLRVQESSMLASQGRFLVTAVHRALADLHALETNSRETNPEAILPIRLVIGHLVAARAETQVTENVADHELLGPVFAVTVSAALAHLQTAETALMDVARAYGAEPIIAGGARGR